MSSQWWDRASSAHAPSRFFLSLEEKLGLAAIVITLIFASGQSPLVWEVFAKLIVSAAWLRGVPGALEGQ